MINRAIKAIIETTAPLHKRYFYNLSFIPEETLSLYSSPYGNTLVWKRSIYALNNVNIVFWMSIFVGIILFFAGSRFLIYKYIWENPSIEILFSYAIVTISVLFDTMSLAVITIFLLPLPYKDYSALEELENLEKISPNLASAKRQTLFSEQNALKREMQSKGYIETE